MNVLGIEKKLAQAKAKQRRTFVGVHIKHRVELGDLQQIVHFLGQMQQFQFTAPAFYSRVCAHQLSDTRAVDVANIPEVHQNICALFLEQLTNFLAQKCAPLTEGNSPADIKNSHQTCVAVRSMQWGHNFLRFPVWRSVVPVSISLSIR